MVSELLEISVHKVTIRYVLRNASDKDVELLIAFPLPNLNGGDLYNSPINLPNEKKLNFVDFAVMADGRPVKPAMEIRAFDGQNDITARLNSVGLSGVVLLSPLNRELLKMPEASRRLLEKDELIMPDDFNPPLPGIGKRGWWPTWTMRVKFYWKQRFPAKRNVELVQTYRPVVGGSYITTDDDGKSSIERYCGTSKTLNRIAEVKRRHRANGNEIALFERRIDYVLTTGNNWNGPIGDFHLVLLTDSQDDILVSCIPGLKQVSETQFELTRRSFRPTEELKLLILQPSR